MNDLIGKITPQTYGIVWLVEDLSPSNPNYTAIDYLLDGLLTANLSVSGQQSSRVIVADSFDHKIHVLISREPQSSEFESFVSLFQKDLRVESDIVVIDEVKGLEKLRKLASQVGPHLKVI